MSGTGLLGKKPMEDDEAAEPAATNTPAEEQAEEQGEASGMEGPAGGDPEANVTPEEQKQYDEFVTNAMHMVYDPKMRVKILSSLQVTKRPVDDLANTAVMVVKGAVSSATKAGTQISDDVIFHGGAEILQDLASYAEKAKIHSFTPDEMEGAWFKALDLYRELGKNDGTIDPDSLKGEFQELVNADKAGKLGDIIPGAQSGAPAPQTGTGLMPGGTPPAAGA